VAVPRTSHGERLVKIINFLSNQIFNIIKKMLFHRKILFQIVVIFLPINLINKINKKYLIINKKICI